MPCVVQLSLQVRSITIDQTAVTPHFMLSQVCKYRRIILRHPSVRVLNFPIDFEVCRVCSLRPAHERSNKRGPPLRQAFLMHGSHAQFLRQVNTNVSHNDLLQTRPQGRRWHIWHSSAFTFLRCSCIPLRNEDCRGDLFSPSPADCRLNTCMIDAYAD